MDGLLSSQPLDGDCLAFRRRLDEDVLARAQEEDVFAFFEELARFCHEVFAAKQVALWDVNAPAGCLVLLASCPKRDPIIGSYAITLDHSITGLAVERRSLLSHVLGDQVDERSFASPGFIEAHRLKWMVSIPLTRGTDESVSLVVNLYFDTDPVNAGLVAENSEIRWFRSALSRCLRSLYQLREAHIRNFVERESPVSRGIASLFDTIHQELRGLTRCQHAQVFAWDAERQRLVLERGSRPEDQQISPQRSSAAEREWPGLWTATAECARPTMLVDTLEWEIAPGRRWPKRVSCRAMASPLLDSSDRLLGLLVCRDPMTDGSNDTSLSSLDVHAVATFAQLLAPQVERVIRLRGARSPASRVLEEVSTAIHDTVNLQQILQRTIDKVVAELNVEIGSIYLLDPKARELVMAAGTGGASGLVNTARYKLGEGLTGTAATGRIINLTSAAAVQGHPAYRGKYDRLIWKASPTHEPHAFLAVPIQTGKGTIGVFKMSNPRPTSVHPDPYFTDEDVQLARFLSSFLAYVIQDHGHRDAVQRRFQLLADMLEIEQAQSEEAAGQILQSALRKAGYPSFVLSLFDPASGLTPELVVGGKWVQTRKPSAVSIDAPDIHATALREGRVILVDDGDASWPPQTGLGSAAVTSQMVLPLRLAQDLLGCLQVDLADRGKPDTAERLTLEALAAHVATALWRLKRAAALTDQMDHVMSSSRFLIAETLSLETVHSLKHQVADIARRVGDWETKAYVRENEPLLGEFRSWHKGLKAAQHSIDTALTLVQTEDAGSGAPVLIDAHTAIQDSIDLWINYVHSHKCKVVPRFRASKSTTRRIRPDSLKEIISVLIVNAVQAFAKTITIETDNEEDITTAGALVQTAICVDVTDDGVLLGTSNHEELFSPTYTTKPSKFGTGLGLYIARTLARRSGGNLVVTESREAARVGTKTFRLIVPAE
jgi:signal transduction histidine kinase